MQRAREGRYFHRLLAGRAAVAARDSFPSLAPSWQAKFARRGPPPATPSIEVAARAPPRQRYIPHSAVATLTTQEDARDRLSRRSPGAPLFLFSLFFSVRLFLADAVALRPMRAPPCRAASWPRSGRRLRRPSSPTSRTRRSTWSARGEAGAPRPPPPRRARRRAIPSPRSSTTVSLLPTLPSRNVRATGANAYLRTFTGVTPLSLQNLFTYIFYKTYYIT